MTPSCKKCKTAFLSSQTPPIQLRVTSGGSSGAFWGARFAAGCVHFWGSISFPVDRQNVATHSQKELPSMEHTLLKTVELSPRLRFLWNAQRLSLWVCAGCFPALYRRQRPISSHAGGVWRQTGSESKRRNPTQTRCGTAFCWMLC
eukprot:5209496-Amphidinium_carterae.1